MFLKESTIQMKPLQCVSHIANQRRRGFIRIKVFNIWEICSLYIIQRAGKNSIADWVWMQMLKWHVMSNCPWLLLNESANTFSLFFKPKIWMFVCARICIYVHVRVFTFGVFLPHTWNTLPFEYSNLCFWSSSCYPPHSKTPDTCFWPLLCWSRKPNTLQCRASKQLDVV